MYQIRIALAIAGIMFFAGCKKETTITIPESVVDTAWESSNGDDERFSLVFDADKCILTKSSPSQEDEVKVFDYRYDRPNLELIEISNPEEKLAGEILTDGESYLLMYLKNADDSVILGFWFVE